MPTRTKEELRDIIHNRSKLTFNGCWEWLGPTYKDGYAKMRFTTDDGYTIYAAHRIMAFLYFAQFKKSNHVCHTCDNRKCVNPRHLYLGTAEDNMNDCTSRGRFTGRRAITEKDVSDIWVLRKNGEPQRRIAARFGIHQTTVSRITRGVRRKKITKHFTCP